MCGISGYLGSDFFDNEKIKNILNVMRSRGPDNQNYIYLKLKENLNLYLFHSRLSIIDLSDKSNQPFKYKNNVMVYNGEIYNYLELKSHLKSKGHTFKTKSDTEVLIKMYDRYKEKAFTFLDGMWSLAIWDGRKLIISRDRFGEKPLFFLKSKKNFIFGSEIKYVKALCKQKVQTNKIFYNNILSNGYFSAFKNEKSTFYKRIEFLKPSENILIHNTTKINKKKYWFPKLSINNSLKYEDARNRIRQIIIDSLEKKMRSDVDIAFSLSGGIDSSVLVNIATKIFNKKISCYSISDYNYKYNEKENININLLNNSNIYHQYVYLPKKNSIKQLKEFINFNQIFPFTITSLAQNFLYKKISKDGFKVCINGTGADEIFTGYYSHYIYFFMDSKNYKNTLNYKLWKLNVSNLIRNPRLNKFNIKEKFKNLYNEYSDYDSELKSVLVSKFENKKIFFSKKDILRQKMIKQTFEEILPVLTYHDDLNSMNYSLENRSPFLDKELFEFVNTLPSSFLVRNGYLKFILRDAFKDILPDKIALNYEKKGFNYELENIINFKSFFNEILGKNDVLNHLVNYKKLNNLIYKNKNQGLKKFLFHLIGICFLENIQ